MASVARSNALRRTNGGSLPVVSARKGLSALTRKRSAATRARSAFAPSGLARNPESPQREPRHDARPVGAEARSGQSRKRRPAEPTPLRTRRKPKLHGQRHGVALRGGSVPANRCELQDSYARSADALRQTTFIKTEREFITGGSSEVCQAVVQTDNEDRSCQSAGRDRWIATLHPPERVAADEEAGGHVARGNAALAPRQGKIAAQLAERMGSRQWNGVRFRHGNSVM